MENETTKQSWRSRAIEIFGFDRQIIQLYDWIITFIFVMVFSLFLVVMSWLFDPTEVLKTNGNIDIKTESVLPGEIVEYETSFCKLKDIRAESTRFIYTEDNVQGLEVDETSRNSPVGCITRTNTFRVPEDAQPGKWYLRITSVYRINPLKEKEYVSQSNLFEIRERE